MSNVIAAENIAVKTRIELLKDSKVSWLVTLLLSLTTRIEKQTDDGQANPTVCVTATHMYINPDYIVELEPKYHKSVFLHESLHLALKHVVRYEDFPDHERYNRACDYIVNNMLFRLGYPIRPSWLFDHKYDNWSLDAIYKDLPPSPDKDKNPDICMKGACSQDDKAGLASRVFTAESLLRGNPTLLATIGQLFEEFRAANSNPLDFKAVLSEFLTDISHDERSWKRLNQRMFASGILAKGYGLGSMKSAVVAFDASGSMTEEQKAITIEQVEFMRDILQIQELHLLVFDDSVKTAINVTYGTPVSTYQLQGGGGTNLNSVYEYIEHHGISPEVLMVFTDMCLHLPPQPPYPVIWVGIRPSQAWVENHLRNPNFYGKYAELKL